ncbi:hypothetical protein H0H93_001523, partial [Arthromyces matolae]
ALGISRIMSSPKLSEKLKATALATRLRFTEFVTSPRFQDFMGPMTIEQLATVMRGLGAMEPESSHDPALTPIVFQLLEKMDPDKHLCTADRIFLAGNQIFNLRENPKALLEYPDPISGHGVYTPNDYLPTYHNWLMSQEYEPWPGVYEVDKVQKKHEGFQGEPRELVLESIAGILLRYTQWKKYHFMQDILADLKFRFKGQLAQHPPLPLETRVVLKAYLWALPGQ